MPRYYLNRVWLTVDRAITPSLEDPLRPSLVPRCPIEDPATYEFIAYITTYDAALGYPFLHRIEGDRCYWFGNQAAHGYVYHLLVAPGVSGLLGSHEVVALPDGSTVPGSLAIFGMEKIAFMLAWVSFCRCSTDNLTSYHFSGHRRNSRFSPGTIRLRYTCPRLRPANSRRRLYWCTLALFSHHSTNVQHLNPGRGRSFGQGRAFTMVEHVGGVGGSTGIKLMYTTNTSITLIVM